MKKRLARGDVGVNTLDSYCKDHDIAYDRSNALADRKKADYILENKAWDRVKAKDSSLKEKAVAWGVTTAMKLKRKLGGGCGFKSAVKAAKSILRKHKGEKDLLKITRKCIAAAKKSSCTNYKKHQTPRIIPLPKTGGMLPLIPIFAGLSALGSLTGGVTGLLKTIQSLNSNRNTPTHLGRGLYIKPYKGGKYKIEKGSGLYVRPYKGEGLRGKGRKMSKN